MMGAEFDVVFDPHEDVEEAFREAVESRAYDYGHRGYSGTLAEKHGYVVVAESPDRHSAALLAEMIDEHCINHPEPSRRINRDYPKYASDKWGPAGAIKVESGGWVFFGWCSS